MDFGLQVLAAGFTGDDRARVVRRGEVLVMVVADGAGGVAGASAASEKVVAHVPEAALESATACAKALERIDRELTHVGECTAVVVVLGKGAVWGASVGDSEAWLFGGRLALELTAEQSRKPLLGSGRACAAGFGPLPAMPRLLIGSDGLFKYVAHDRIVEIVSRFSPKDAAAGLVRAARLPSGKLQDDVAVIVAGLAS